MTFDGRYISNEKRYLAYAYTALQEHFPDSASFEAFYSSLASAEKKDEFLRVTTFYLFLVKQGDWYVLVEDSIPVVDYLTNSFKLVALFSLIESMTDLEHQDCYEWLCCQDKSTTFPIADPKALNRLHENYKKSFGSIRRCVAFFERLPPQHMQVLLGTIFIDGVPLSSIKKLAQYLYNLRSKFVHEARLVLQVSNSAVLSRGEKGVIRTILPISMLLEAFEEGVLAYFRNET